MNEFAYIIVLLITAYFVYHYYIHSRGSFSWQNVSKSMTFLGVLALVLILFITAVIMLLRAEV